jgi:hypothetical protein
VHDLALFEVVASRQVSQRLRLGEVDLLQFGSSLSNVRSLDFATSHDIRVCAMQPTLPHCTSFFARLVFWMISLLPSR